MSRDLIGWMNSGGSTLRNVLERIGIRVPLLLWPAGKWSPLGQDRIAYGATGWEIQFSANPRYAPYLLTDPELRPLAYGPHLEDLKSLCERMELERRQFRGCNT